jgi:SRSO17 transposase
MIDELIGWGRTPPVLSADAGYGDTTAFRQGLTDREISYVVAVKGATSAYPGGATPQTAPYAGRGRPAAPRYRDPRQSCKDLVVAAGRAALKTVTWRHGTKADPDNPAAAMRSRFLALRIRPANRDITPADDGSLPEAWLLAEWPTGAAEPTDYWISTLGPDTPLAELVRLAKIRWRIEHDYRELKTALGLDHFEGRSSDRLAPPRHPRHRRPPVPHHPAADRPKSHWAGLTLYGIVRELQRALAYWIGTCPQCHHTFPT